MTAPPTTRYWRETFELYHAADRESGEIRARHLQQVLRLTPLMMAANVICGPLVVWLLRGHHGALFSGWLLASGALVVTASAGWWRARRRVHAVASRRAFRRATLHAAALGLIWGLLPAGWFADLAAAPQLAVACLVTGMLGAGAFALAVLPAASLAYAGLLTAFSLVALLRAGEPTFGAVAVLISCYGSVVVMAAMSVARRATALLRAQYEQARQNQLVSLLLRDFEDNAHDVLWETDREGLLLHASERLMALLDEPVPTSRGVPFFHWLDRHGASGAAVVAALRGGRPFRDLRLRIDSAAATRWCAVSAKPHLLADGQVAGWRGVISDVTEQVNVAVQLHELAHHDSLTGLVNRVTLHEAAQQALDAADGGALPSIDLDHFKAVNDTLGHSCGDAVLCVVASRLRAIVRPQDLVARLGGDEFALLLAGPVGGREAQALAQRVALALREPIEVRGRQLRVGASVGIAHLHTEVSGVEELLVNADLALYDAKASGRGRYASYSAQLGERSRRSGLMEQALCQGADAGQFQLHFQPKVSLHNWRISGVQALLRWHHPDLGPVSPAEFIQAAERCGQIHELGDWALRQACAAALQLPGLTVAVNVSPLQLQERHFVERVQAALAHSGLESGRLELEVTESVLLDDAEGAIEQLHRLRRLGPRIALDDFGTGYSSLAYLRRFPFDELKIDRTFVRELTSRSDARAIVHMIVRLATELGMGTVAEGVETTQQLEIISTSGCRAIQGYLASRPLPLHELVAVLNGWSERPALASVH